MRREDRMLLAGLLDKLGDLLRASYEYKELSTDEANRSRREIDSLCSKIKLCLAQEFQVKTPTGEQRAIRGVVE